jgi:glucosamine--fructose-6-phosphate aminotransferase (isomerizing)
MSADGKNGFPHYMLKEIHEQPEAVRQTIEACVSSSGRIALPRCGIPDEEIRSVRKILIAASGSSRHAGLAAEFMIERMTGVPVKVDFASQYCYRDPIVEQGELAVFISQSGTTVDTVAALQVARDKGAKTLAICNVDDTPLTRDADAVVLTYAGKETSIAATKSFTTQLTALFLLAAHIAQARGVSAARVNAALGAARRLPEEIATVLGSSEQCLELARVFQKYESFLFLGRDIDYPIALEGALKLKEVSYIHAEGYPTGEMKHGPSAMIDETLPLVVLATCDDSDSESVLRYEKTVSNVREIRERGTPVLAIMTEGDTEMSRHTPHVLEVPDVPVLLQPLLEVVPLQLLAYHVAVLRGRDVDRPRHLSKSVVVE